MAMESICAQVRAAVKKRHADNIRKKAEEAGTKGKNKLGSLKGLRGRTRLDGDEYQQTVKQVFQQLDLDGNKVLDREEVLTGLFSLGVHVAEDETDLLLRMFGSKRGFTYEQFAKLVIGGDTTRRKRSAYLPALQREHNIARMAAVSKAKRRDRIRGKSTELRAGRPLYRPIVAARS